MLEEPSYLQANTANFTPLSPVSLVRRAAKTFPDAVAIISEYGEQNWRDTFTRCQRIAGGLRQLGISQNVTVSVLAQNIPAAVELSYGVPMSGGVLNMLNTRLDPAGIAFILEHAETKVLFVDDVLQDLASKALDLCKTSPTVILIQSEESQANKFDLDYEQFLADAVQLEAYQDHPDSEWDSIALNYTSGTTGNPKGVLYHHRGAYLNALGNAIEWSLPQHPRYLWTLPLFHCNGWCFPWTIAAKAGVNICIRSPAANDVIIAIEKHKVTHMCGAPIVLNLVSSELKTRAISLKSRVAIMTAGASPTSAVLATAKSVGFDVTHVYGLTEVYGPTAVCAWKPEWDALPENEQAAKRARQGVNYTVLEELSVRDPETHALVPKDGNTIGEVTFRGNPVMKGYLKNEPATIEAFNGGHFWSGDLAVWYEDGYVAIKDRSKDIIISGGENISSLEVESAIYQHSAVSEAAVVAGPHPKWGETPIAFVELRPNAEATEAELIEHCRALIARFKCPTRVVFTELPKTSTGKIQKYTLRELAKNISNINAQ